VIKERFSADKQAKPATLGATWQVVVPTTVHGSYDCYVVHGDSMVMCLLSLHASCGQNLAMLVMASV
jgi:hypothetical protein